MTIDEFASKEIELVMEFVAFYKAENAKDPDSYPLDHAYEWHEQLEMYKLCN